MGVWKIWIANKWSLLHLLQLLLCSKNPSSFSALQFVFASVLTQPHRSIATVVEIGCHNPQESWGLSWKPCQPILGKSNASGNGNEHGFYLRENWLSCGHQIWPKKSDLKSTWDFYQTTLQGAFLNVCFWKCVFFAIATIRCPIFNVLLFPKNQSCLV